MKIIVICNHRARKTNEEISLACFVKNISSYEIIRPFFHTDHWGKLCFWNPLYAQTAMVSVEPQNVPREVLKDIEKQSDFDFFYNNNQIDLNRRVSVSSRNSDIFNVLDQMFAGTNVSYSVLDKSIILSQKKWVSILYVRHPVIP